MHKKIRNGARIFLAATILVAGVVCLGTGALRVRYHLWALHRAERTMFNHGTLAGEFPALFSGYRDWSQARDHHEESLVHLGYLSRQEFPFTNRTLNAVQLMTNAQSRFATRMTLLCVLTNGQALSATSVCTSSVVRVTAPRNEEEQWRKLISEFDRKTR